MTESDTGTMDAETLRRLEPRAYLQRFVSRGVRPDGRAAGACRKVTVTTGSVSRAVGSALVKMGRTTAVAALKGELFETDDEEGEIDVSVELLATSSLHYRQVRASDDAPILTHRLRQAVGSAVDRRALAVEGGLLAWRLSLVVHVVDDAGNVADAVLLAADAALKNCLLPTVRLVDDDDEDDDENAPSEGKTTVLAKASRDRCVPLQLNELPVPVSFALVGEHALIDPTRDEEAAADGSLSFVLGATSVQLRAVDKPGGTAVSTAVYDACLAQAKQRTQFLSKKLGLV